MSVNDLWGHEVRSASDDVHRCLCLLCQAKVYQKDVVVSVKENVFRFDVAVDDALAVGGVEGVGNFDADFQHLLDGQTPREIATSSFASAPMPS